MLMPWMLAINICETFKLMKNVVNLQQCCTLVTICTLMESKKLQKGVFWRIMMDHGS